MTLAAARRQANRVCRNPKTSNIVKGSKPYSDIWNYEKIGF
jgi:hypothetical protein